MRGCLRSPEASWASSPTRRFRTRPVSAVEAILDRDEEPRGATIVRGRPARISVSPGEELPVTIRPAAVPGRPRREANRDQGAAERAPGPLDLVVADGASWSEYRLRAEAVAPADFADQLTQVGRLESSTTLVVALEARERGVALPGASEPGVPPSWSFTLTTWARRARPRPHPHQRGGGRTPARVVSRSRAWYASR